MSEYRSLPDRLTLPVRCGLACLLGLCCLVFLGLLRYPTDIAILIGFPSAVIFGLAIARPAVAMVTLIFLFPLLPLLPTNLGVANVSLLGYLLLAMAAGRSLVRIKKGDKIRLPRTPIDVPLAVFLALSWISCLTVPFRYSFPWNRVFLSDLLEILPRIFFYREGDMFLSLTATLLFSLGAFFFWQLWERKREIGERRIVRLLLAGLVVSVVFALYQRGTGKFIPQYWIQEGQAPRVNGLFPDPNSFGTYLVSLFFLFSFSATKKPRWFAWLTLPILVLALVFTGSRAAWLSLLLVLLGLGLTYLWRWLRKWVLPGARLPRWYFVLGVFLSAVIVYSGYEYALRADAREERGTYIGRILTLFNRSDTFNHILKGRPTMWYAALNMTREFPATGVGVGLYREVMPHFLEAGQTYWWARKKENAHNYFLQVGGEMGIPGLVGFVWICVGVFAVYVRTRGRGASGRTQRAAFLAIIALLVTTLGAHPLIQIEIQMLFWILVLLVCSSSESENSVRTPNPSGLTGPQLAGIGLIGFSLLAGVWQARSFFPYHLYDLGVNTWENLGSPGQWTPRKEWFRWTKGSAVLLVRRTDPRVSMRLKLGRPGVAPGERVEVSTRLADRTERRFSLSGEEERTIVLDLVGLNEDVVPLRIRTSSVWPGLRFRGQRDWRTLGVRAYYPFPHEYPTGFAEGLGEPEIRDGLLVRFLQSERAFFCEAAEGGSLVIPIWIEKPAGGGLLEIYLGMEREAVLPLVRGGWQRLEFSWSEGGKVPITLVVEGAQGESAGVGRVSWLP